MAKRQNYTVVFKSDQTTVMNAMHQIATPLLASWGNTIESHATAGRCTTDAASLDSSGTVLTVQRTMADSCYNELKTIYLIDSASGYQNLLNSLASANASNVDSARGTFTDV